MQERVADPDEMESHEKVNLERIATMQESHSPQHSWEELISLIGQEPDHSLGNFQRALVAATSASERGYISEFEMDLLLRAMVASVIYNKLNDVITRSIFIGQHPVHRYNQRRPWLNRQADSGSMLPIA